MTPARFSHLTGDLGMQNFACYVDAYEVTADSPASSFSLGGMPITCLIGTDNCVEDSSRQT